MASVYQKALESAEYIRERVAIIPDVAVVLGSGISGLANEVQSATTIDYSDVPYFPVTSVVGHKGQLVFGKMTAPDVIDNKGDREQGHGQERGQGHGHGQEIDRALVQGHEQERGHYIKETDVLFALGRVHLYEGFEAADVVYYIRVFKLLGIKYLILTNAAGGVNTEFRPGDIMLITDHIGLFAPSPLAGENEDEFGVRFPDMTAVYDAELANIAKSAAKSSGIRLRKGVYAYTKGPMFETSAEIKSLRILGADAVGMSTVPEAIVANQCGIKVLGFSLISNMAAGILDKPLTHEEVIETGHTSSEKFSRLVRSVIRHI